MSNESCQMFVRFLNAELCKHFGHVE
jgi:hypothetical protein